MLRCHDVVMNTLLAVAPEGDVCVSVRRAVVMIRLWWSIYSLCVGQGDSKRNGSGGSRKNGAGPGRA
jgi:hypothetical protein